MKARLSFEVDDRGGLVIAPIGASNCVSLRLREESVDLLCAKCESVCLPWTAYGNIRRAMDGPALDGWEVTQFAVGPGGIFGVAIGVSGRYDVASHDLFLATTSRWRRFNQSSPMDPRCGHVLPVLPKVSAFTACKPERDSFIALTTVLARRDDLRASLSDRARTARLAGDLSIGLLPFPVQRTGARRDTVDIIIAMHQAGFVHTFARPLTREALPELSDIVARTRSRLEASPYRKGRTLDDDTIAEVVRRTYLDVKPWPFAALIP